MSDNSQNTSLPDTVSDIFDQFLDDVSSFESGLETLLNSGLGLIADAIDLSDTAALLDAALEEAGLVFDDLVERGVEAADGAVELFESGVSVVSGRIIGSAGNDFLEGLASDDTLTGGRGADVFRLTNGIDVITDFNPEEDILDLSNFAELSPLTDPPFDDLGSLIALAREEVVDEVAALVLALDGPDSDNLTILRGISLNDLADATLFFGETLSDIPVPSLSVSQRARGEFTLSSGDVFEVTASLPDADLPEPVQIVDGVADTLDRILGGTEADILIGEAGNDLIEAFGLADYVFGSGGDDTILGGGGSDLLSGDTGNDEILGGSFNDTLLGGRGDDMLRGGTGRDLLLGDDGHDQLFGESGDDNLAGEDGNDSLYGGGGSDTLIGGGGRDSLIGGTGQDQLDGGGDKDTLRGAAGNDSLSGGSDKDSLVGGRGTDTLDGGNGDDTLTAGNGDDIVLGGDGDDLLQGSGGGDTLIGGGGSDILRGGRGDDVLAPERGAATLTGGGGRDRFIISEDNRDTRITDFTSGEDVLDLSNLSPTPSALPRALTTEGLMISLPGGGTLLLTGLEQLTAQDFTF